MLTLIAVGFPEGCRRDQLLAYFWPEADTASARNSLRQALAMLRRHLDGRPAPETEALVARFRVSGAG